MFVTRQPSSVYLVHLVCLVCLVYRVCVDCLVRRLRAPQSSVLSHEIPILSTQHSALGPKPSGLDRVSPFTFHLSPFTL